VEVQGYSEIQQRAADEVTRWCRCRGGTKVELRWCRCRGAAEVVQVQRWNRGGEEVVQRCC